MAGFIRCQMLVRLLFRRIFWPPNEQGWHLESGPLISPSGRRLLSSGEQSRWLLAPSQCRTELTSHCPGAVPASDWLGRGRGPGHSCPAGQPPAGSLGSGAPPAGLAGTAPRLSPPLPASSPLIIHRPSPAPNLRLVQLHFLSASWRFGLTQPGPAG